MTLDKSWNLTEARFARRNSLKKRGQVFCGTPLGRKATSELFLTPLADFLAGKHDEKPDQPPRWLAPLICDLDPAVLALMALAPLLNGIYGGWEGADSESALMLLKLKVGTELRDRLALEKLSDTKPNWTNEECVRAGHWLLQCALDCFGFFTLNERGDLEIAPEWQEDIDQIREDILRRDPVLLPHSNPPPDWTGPIAKYDARLQAPFVRDWRRETQQLVKEAFNDDSIAEHTRAVNALQRVPLRIERRILALVEKFAVDIMGHEDKQRKADRRTVRNDIAHAEALGDDPFYLTYNCDKRGRVYPIPHLNYGREDHVRALFKFHNGMELGRGDVQWLEIHCANCNGSDGIDKLPDQARIVWAAFTNRNLIKKIAADPEGTVDLWKKADQPFQFVAACIELAAAWANPTKFKTHLPISFDGTCNGLQHLSLLSRDRESATAVNLSDPEGLGYMHDVYTDIAKLVLKNLKTDDNKWALWWTEKLAGLSPRQIRKLFKTPAGTFAYAATDWGRHQQITKVYRELFDGLEPKDAAGVYLAKKIQEAAEELLPGPTRVMRYIQKLVGHCNDRNCFLKWTSPTGFPCCNRYNTPNEKIINLKGNGSVRIRHKIAEGGLSEINKSKTLAAAAANFVHSQDASHLIKLVNAANARGVADILVVHDCFAFLAPQAALGKSITRGQLAFMYVGDPIGELRQMNIGNVDFEPAPPLGDFDPMDVLFARNPFS